MTFRVGQKVTQTRTFKWPRHGYDEVVPEFGAVYTVRAINQFEGSDFLHFYEIRNPVCDYTAGTFEMDFVARLFRPVVERKTDIAIFTALLDPETKVRESV